MTKQRWDQLLRKMMRAQDRGDRLTCLLIVSQLKRCLAEGGPR